MTERCDFSDLPVDGCSHCTGRVGDEAPRDFTVVNRFTARYDGRCASCDLPFHEGSLIGRAADGDYVCAGCFP